MKELFVAFRTAISSQLACVARKLRIRINTDTPTLLGHPPIVPDNWIYVQDPGYKVGRFQIFNN